MSNVSCWLYACKLFESISLKVPAGVVRTLSGLGGRELSTLRRRSAKGQQQQKLLAPSSIAFRFLGSQLIHPSPLFVIVGGVVDVVRHAVLQLQVPCASLSCVVHWKLWSCIDLCRFRTQLLGRLGACHASYQHVRMAINQEKLCHKASKRLNRLSVQSPRDRNLQKFGGGGFQTFCLNFARTLTKDPPRPC